MKHQLLRPLAGSRVRTPEGTILPPEGAVAPLIPYWLRRLKEGDVFAAPSSQPLFAKEIPHGHDL